MTGETSTYLNELDEGEAQGLVNKYEVGDNYGK